MDVAKTSPDALASADQTHRNLVMWDISTGEQIYAFPQKNQVCKPIMINLVWKKKTNRINFHLVY